MENKQCNEKCLEISGMGLCQECLDKRKKEEKMNIPFNMHLFKERLLEISKEYELSVDLDNVLNEDDIEFLLSNEKLNFGYIVEKYCDDGLCIDDIQKVDFKKEMEKADADYIKLQSAKEDLINLFNEFSKVL